MSSWSRFVSSFVLALTMAVLSASAQEESRSVDGLQVLYDFSAGEGALIRDRSDAGKALDLKIANLDAVRWIDGALEFLKPVKIRGEKPAGRLAAAIRKSGAISIEVWLRPANLRQEGPARIVTMSKNSSERNFTFGQEGDRFEARLRTTKTGTNGSKPALESAAGAVRTQLTHLVYTRSRGGQARLFVNGQSNKAAEIRGEVSNWADGFVLALGDELSGERAWLGSLHLVAIYDRALAPGEIQRHFRAGAEASAAPDDEARQKADALTANRRLFEKKIAPLLAEHCIECHDTATHEGKLDLSRRNPAHAVEGIILAGKAADSLLWESVESDEMPEDRDPLSAAEKKLLREWIDGGAEWTLERIDPAVYVHAGERPAQWVRRLTVDEYIETVRATLGIDIEEEARELLPADLRADGFSNTAYNLTIDLKHIEAYARLAELIVERLDTKEFAERFTKSRSVADDKKMEGMVAKMGRWLLRGPLDSGEVFAFRGIMTTVASAGGDFDEAFSYVVEAMLQAPRFIYRIENQRVGGDTWTIDDHELAARLSYIIWGASPDQALSRAVDAGSLGSEAKLRGEVKRMLDDPRARRQALRFAENWLNLGRLSNLQPDAKKFPGWDAVLADDMRTETLAFFEEVVWKQKRPLAELLNAQVTFVTPRLAEHYRLPEAVRPKGVATAEAQRIDLGAVHGRGGLLTQGSVLTIGGDDASMVTRGLFVFHDLLRGVVKNPPAGLDVTPEPTKPGVSHRVAAERRLAHINCGGCHDKFEPLAFGLEKFDGLGSWFDVDEHDNTLREDGEVRIPGEAKPRTYQSVDELMDILASSERVAESLTWKLTQFALGRRLTADDAPLVEQVHRAAVAADGGSYRALITALVSSDLVRKSFAVEGDG